MLGESLHYVNMIDCYSIEDIVKLLVQKVQDEPHLPFIIGFNWDHTKLGRLPHRGDIDSITDKPVSFICHSHESGRAIIYILFLFLYE